MTSTHGGAFARLVAGGTAAATAFAGLTIGLAAPAHAAVTVSGNTIDAAGNYVDGFVYVYRDEDGDGTIESFEYDFALSTSTTGGAFDLALEDGTYKLEFYPTSGSDEYQSEYYRDKADIATADVITVAGAAQVLPAWTIDSIPTVTGTVATTDGRAVRNATVVAYAADDGTPLASDSTNASGAFSIGAQEAVKLRFSGNHPVTGKTLATEYYSDKADLATADAVVPGASVGTVTLAPGGSISGRVVSDAAGVPLHRVEVCAESSYCDYTDANGIYTIEGVTTGAHEVYFSDPIDEFLPEYFNNVAVDEFGDPVSDPIVVNVGPGAAVTGIDAGLATKSKPALTGVDLSGVVRDQLGGIGVGYDVVAYDTPANPLDRKVVARTISNRSGGYAFTTLDRIGGETEFKVVVEGEAAREDGEFARRSIWTGQKYGYDTAAAISSAPQVIDFVQPVAGGIAGAVTSELGGVPENPYVAFLDEDGSFTYSDEEFEADGTYETRSLWPGEYKAQFGATRHVSEWWDDAVAAEAKTVTVKPGEVVTGISAALAAGVKAVERPTIEGDAWVKKTLHLDKGVWTQMADNEFTYEWLVKDTVIATGPSLKLTKKHLGDKITGRVTNDIGFTQGQAITKTTYKVGYKPKVKANVSKKSAAITLKVKPLKAKKVKATVTVFELVGVKKNGDDKLKKLGKAKIKKGKGVVRFKKALSKGKHKLVFTVKGKGKVGSGDIMKKVKIKR